MFHPRTLTIITILFLGLAACTGDAGTADDTGDDAMGDDGPADPVLASIQGGSFGSLAPYTGIAGQAVVARRLDGKTEVSITLSGLAPSASFMAHVHAQPCAYQGGGHYKIDPLVADTIEANELWLAPASSANGVATAQVTFDHLARGDALAIVVHDPAAAGAKMACADLATDDPPDAAIVHGGTVAPLAPAQPIDAALAGQVSAWRAATGTAMTLQLSGLDPAAVYNAHVHAEPCAIDKGSGHYKLDPTVTETVPENELWFTITDHPAGTFTASLQVSHVMRTDAQSVVLHRQDPTGTPKVACADLARTTESPPLVTSGSAMPLASLALTGEAIMTRTITGATAVRVDVAGLSASTTYKAHVHDQPCAVDQGGGHYLIDRAVPAGETNEVWLEIVAGAAGAGSDMAEVAHVTRAEAQSVVLHAPDAQRLACFDLRRR